MGTPLTGLTQGATYNAVLKTTANTNVDGTLRTVSDGLGNDSALQVSTGGVHSTGTLSAAGVVSSTASGKQFLFTGQLGSPAYATVDQTANSGKVWRAGNTGAVDYNTYDIYDETDGVIAGSFSSSGLSVPGLKVTSSTPASAAAAGVAGTITWDSGYIYVCVATNTWKRVAISTW